MIKTEIQIHAFVSDMFLRHVNNKAGANLTSEKNEKEIWDSMVQYVPQNSCR